MDQVLDAAQEAFWVHGYEGTSIHDLLEATGLQRGSLYKAFGDKQGLFLQTLDRYHAAGQAMVKDVLHSNPRAVEGLRAWLRAIADGCPVRGPRAGCFVVNTTVELGPHHEEVALRNKQHRKAVCALLEERVRQAQADGDLLGDLDPRAAAQHLFLVASGLTVEGKGGSPTAQRRRQAELALQLLSSTKLEP